MVTGIELAFPGLIGTEYKVTSPKDDDYNWVVS